VSAKKTNIEQIRKYLNGELDARAMYKLERQAQDDPFLMDVIKGMESSDENHQPNLNDIDRLIRERVGQDRKRVIPMWKLVPVAASLLIALGIGGWWVAHQHQEVAVVVNAPKIEQPDKVKIEERDTTKPLTTVAKPPMIAQASRSKVEATVTSASPQIANNAVEIKADTNGHKASAYPIVANAKQEKLLKEVAVLSQNADKRPLAAANSAIVTNSYLKTGTPKVSDTISRALIGQVAGVQVNDGNMGYGQNIVIRGNNTLMQGQGKVPLYIIDGVPIENYNLGLIKPTDIKSINVLKDTEAMALYGSRASNGAIAINTTTKGLNSTGILFSTQDVADTAAVMTKLRNNAKKYKGSESVQVIDDYGDHAAGGEIENTTKIITGRVVDKDGNIPLPGVSVKAEGSKIATQTNAAGKFSIALPTNNGVLDIAYIGYENQQVKVKNRDSLKIALSVNNSSLNEVVVTGYGQAKKTTLTGSVATIQPASTKKTTLRGSVATIQLASTIKKAHPQIGWDAYKKYIKDNATMPNGKTGSVRVAFTVDAKGVISNIKIIKGASDDMNQKAIKLIQNGSKWFGDKDGLPKEIKLKIRFH
jgi:TonB family protein